MTSENTSEVVWKNYFKGNKVKLVTFMCVDIETQLVKID